MSLVGLKKKFLLIFLTLSCCFFNSAYAHSSLSISPELSSVWQSRNEFRIPGDGGTLVDVARENSGPSLGFRVYLSYAWGESKHEIRGLYAPLSITATTRFAEAVRFLDNTFSAGAETEAFYKFNSYRLGYTYFLDPMGRWTLGLGFTCKIRDAEIRLTQGETVASKKNIGFVPLLRFQALGSLGENSRVRFDIDGLAAPQGRAFDATIRFESNLAYFGAGHSLWGFLGYRTVEGGADNDEVYNFAWFHSVSLGVYAEF
jgi:hypothetical protein